MSKFSPISSSEWAYPPKAFGHNIILWGPSGLLAAATESTLTIYVYKSFQILPLYSINPFNSPITTMSWCLGCDKNGQTPTNIFLGFLNGQSAVLSLSAMKVIAHYYLSDGFFSSSSWSKIDPNTIYAGSSSGALIKFDLSIPKDGNASIQIAWNVPLGFPVEFISISPKDYSRILASSKGGQFRYIDCQFEDQPPTLSNTKAFSTTDGPVVRCKFFHLLSNAVLFITSTAAYLYFIDDDAIIEILNSDIIHEPILDIFSPPADESILFCVHPSHARVFSFNQISVDRMQIMKCLDPLRSVNQTILCADIFEDSLAVLTRNYTINIFSMRGKKVYAESVFRGMLSKPSCFDFFNGSIAIGTKSGFLQITENGDTEECQCSAFKYCLKVSEHPIKEVYWISSQMLLVLCRDKPPKTYQKVLLVNIGNRTITPVLKQSIERVSNSPISICVSPLKTAFAVVVESSVFVIFSINEDGIKEIGTIMETESCQITFSDKRNKFWIVSSEKRFEYYSISENKLTQEKITTIKNYAPDSTALSCMFGFLICGTPDGEVVIFDWEQLAIKHLQILHQPISKLSISPDRSCCLIGDSASNVVSLYFNEGSFTYEPTSTKANEFVWIDSNALLCRFPEFFSLSLVKSADMKTRLAYIPTKLQDSFLFMDTASQKAAFLQSVCKKCPIEKARRICSEMGFCLLSTILSAITPRFSDVCFCTNFSKDRMIAFLKMIERILSRSRGNDLRSKRVRTALMVGDEGLAFSLLVTSDPSSPTFTADVLKAALIGHGSVSNGVSSSIAALVSGEHYNDAIDLFLLTNQPKQAIRLFITNGNQEAAIHTSSTMLTGNENADIIEAISKSLLTSNSIVQAAAYLVSLRKFDDAACILEGLGCGLTTAILKSIVEENGELFVDFGGENSGIN